MKIKLEKEAATFRRNHGFTNVDPINLKSLLLKLNVITLFKPLSEQFSGMAVKVDNYRFMLINSNHSVGRQHFSICHELYHLYIQADLTPHHCQTGVFDKKNTSEYEADLFAAYVLLPKDGVLSLIPNDQLAKDKIKLETILKIEQYFRCSRAALLVRLKELGLISNALIENFKNDVITTAMYYGYNDALYLPANKELIIGDYGSLAKQLFDNEKISEGHYIDLMHSIGFDTFKKEN